MDRYNGSLDSYNGSLEQLRDAPLKMLSMDNFSNGSVCQFSRHKKIKIKLNKSMFVYHNH